MDPYKRRFVTEKVREMESQGLIEPSSSSWASPLVLPKKKNGEYRLCVDFRKLNAKTVSNAYPIPDLRELLRQVQGAKVFSTLDLNSGYWQVEVEEESRPLTAFITPRGLFQFKVMPFGLKNAPATFVCLMDKVLSGYIGEFCQVYLDDILIYSKNFQEHLVHLAKVIERLKAHGLTCQLKKCHFASSRVDYLGHVLTPEGLERQPEKNKAIEEAERPRTKRQLRQFLGLCGWYSSFVPHFEEKAAPLTDLLNKKQPFRWTAQEDGAFQTIKNAICHAPKLAHPDPQRELCLQTDASDLGLGAVIFHKREDGGRDIVEYGSRKLSPTERCYCTAEKEALAVVWAVGKFRGYFEGRKFRLYTDNSSLQWLNKGSGTKSKLMRWALLLSEFDFEICHVPGTANEAADSLSRNPAEERQPAETIPEREIPNMRMEISKESVLLVMKDELTLETIRRWQGDDEPCQRMIQWINKRNADNHRVPKEFKMCYKNFRVEDGILRYGSQVSNSPSVPVLPRSFAGLVLERFHDSVEAGHPGREETFQSIRRRVFWVNMRKEIADYVQSCYICACTKASNQKASSSMRGRRPCRPWEVVALDLMGPYPRTAKGKTGLLVVTDIFTRWVEAFSIPEATTGRIITILQNEVFSRYGYPRCLLTDNGTQFTSRQWQQAATSWGVEHWTTPIYHPRANPTERRNQELKRLLRIHLLGKEHKKWDQHLPQALFSLRQRVNRITGFSPAELFLGRQLHRAGDWNLVSEKEIPVSVATWQKNQQRTLDEKHDTARERTLHHAEDRDVEEDVVYQSGQLVLRRNHTASNKMDGVHAGLAPKWIGPFEVDRRLGHGTYLLRTTPPVKVHAAELKPVNQPLRDVVPMAVDPSDAVGEEEDPAPRYNLRPRRH